MECGLSVDSVCGAPAFDTGATTRECSPADAMYLKGIHGVICASAL